MKAVIVGCGKVGTELAATLVNDGHDVLVIDNDADALEHAAEMIDIMTLWGNGADINILREAGLENADIFIAVSPYDELNLLSCVIAGSFGGIKTIARVRNPLYSKEYDFLKQRLGLSKIINPEYDAAREIYKLLQYPALSRIDNFANGKVIICTLHVREEYGLSGKSLMESRKNSGCDILACAVCRNNEITIPSGSFVIETGDDITFVSTVEEMKKFFVKLHVNNNPAENCLITGGGTIAYYLTEKLLSKNKQVRIIENNEKRCQILSEYFPKAEIIYGDGTDRKSLIKHGVQKADAFVALTGIDEENVIIANYAKNCSDAKVITKINRTDLNDIVDALDIDSVVFPKFLCADKIAQYVRALDNGIEGNIEKLFRYLDNRVEVMEFKANYDPKLCNISFTELNLKKNIIVACIIRNGEFIIPSGKNMIKDQDSVVIVTTNKGIFKLSDILAK